MFLAQFGVLLVSVVLVTSNIPSETCLAAVIRIGRRATEFNEPEGTWSVYKTNDLQFACTDFKYTKISDINGTHRANGEFFIRRAPDMRVDYNISVVEADKNQYVTVRKMDGQVTLYHRLRPDRSTTHRHYWCAFACESDGIYVKTLVCFIDNINIVPTVDEVVAEVNLPFRSNFTVYNVYEDCSGLALSPEL